MRTLEKAERELAQGNLWRAKEILQGALPNAGYSAELFEKYGIVLLRMGDLPEAGKFLFLSGIKKSEYDEAIGIFLRKYGRNKPHDFFRTFPHKARLATLSEYPDDVAKMLRELDFPEVLKDAKGQVAISSETGSDAVAWVACLLSVVLIGALVILGIIKLKDLLS